jgi:hypothetical protein
MIDPKFDKIPVDKTDNLSESESEDATRKRTSPARGLSINDTIARDANLSVGARGVDTSGVSAGAGAGAGSTSLTPAAEGSPAPRIVSGGRGSGTTALSEKPTGETSTDRTSFDKKS